MATVDSRSLAPIVEPIKDAIGWAKSVVGSVLNRLLRWGRRSSLWPVHLVVGCCSPEEMALFAPRYDAERFGMLPMPGIRQSDVLLVVGQVVYKMAEKVKLTYDQLPEPKYVAVIGECASSGGLYHDSYSVVKGVDKIVPVDVYITGCPPRPEAWIEGLRDLMSLIKEEEPYGK